MRRPASFLIILSALMLAACQSQKDGPTSITFSKDVLMDNSILMENAKEPANTQTNAFSQFKANTNAITVDDKVVTTNFATSGLIIKKNEQGYIGFYSLIKSQYILPPQFVPNWLEYSVVQNVDGVGFLLRIHYEDKYLVYDGLGNRLVSQDNAFQSFQYETRIINKQRYLKLVINNKNSYYEYNSSTGLATAIASYPEEVPEEDASDYESPLFGRLFSEGWMDLADFGRPDYKLALNAEGYVSIFNGDVYQSSFYFDGTTNKMLCVANDNIILQRTYLLPADSTKYSYSLNDEKYGLEHSLVSLETGAKKTVNYNVVFDDAFGIIKNKDKASYYYATYRKINNDLSLGDRVTSLVDNKFVFHDDISGVHIDSFVKYKNNNSYVYYNTVSQVLYDEYFKVITYLGNINPVYIKSLNMFEGTIDGKKGLVDLNGVTKLEFRYSDIYVDSFVSGKGLAKKDGKIYQVKLSNNSTNDTLLGQNAREVVPNLFAYESTTGSELYYYSPKYDVILTVKANMYQQFVGSFLDDKGFVAVIDTSGEDPVINTIYPDNYSPFVASTDVAGVENTNEIFDGSELAKATPVALGDNTVHLLNRNNFNVNYVSFTAPSDSVYTFSWDDEDIYESNAGHGPQEVNYELEKGETQVITFVNTHSDYKQTLKLNVSRDQGVINALEYDFDNSSNNYFAYIPFGKTATRLLKFKAPISGRHIVNLTDSTSYKIESVYYLSSNDSYTKTEIGNYVRSVEGATVWLKIEISNNGARAEGNINFSLSSSNVSITSFMGTTFPTAFKVGLDKGISNENLQYSSTYDVGYIAFYGSRPGYYYFDLELDDAMNVSYWMLDKNGEMIGTASPYGLTTTITNLPVYFDENGQTLIVAIDVSSTGHKIVSADVYTTAGLDYSSGSIVSLTPDAVNDLDALSGYKLTYFRISFDGGYKHTLDITALSYQASLTIYYQYDASVTKLTSINDEYEFTTTHSEELIILLKSPNVNPYVSIDYTRTMDF